MSKEAEQKKTMARNLYLNGMSQKEVAEHCGVSRNTVAKWISAGGWEEARAAKNITRPELVNKLLLACNKMLDQLNDADDPELYATVADKISKLSNTIERLDKKASIVDAIEVFIAFGKWLEYRSKTDAEITVDFLKKLNHYQDMYISENIGK